MSLDSSLKTGGRLVKHRNVLTRAERIARLVETNTFDMAADDPLGLVKVANRKVVSAKSAKKAKASEGEEGGEAQAAGAETPTT